MVGYSEKTMLYIKDRDGTISKAEMQRMFEQAVRDTPALKATAEIGSAVMTDGVIDYYADEKTNALWAGWALGMRCAERLSK